MKSVLYVSHGSRVEEAKKQAENFIQSVQSDVNVPLQQICFLEIVNPGIPEGVERLVNAGADEIAVIPVLLFAAGHYYKDIPEEIDQLRDIYPHVTFTYGKPLGVQERLIDIMAERIRETQITPSSAAKILVVGRGSKNPATKKAIETIGRKLKQKTNVARVESCFLAVLKPSFDEAVHKSYEDGEQQVFIVPYLWFTGVLMRSMEDKIKDYGGRFILCQHLGSHPNIQEALRDRVMQALGQTPENQL
ncbi:sirohydrochlorin chelatase [Halobacillus rhizosphaerae]|uniref:sirohydrochlorin chelatase n=1 Tax=Halobacillus rhizosphaerae TaxID=3064889 RepID=UPI00398B4100